MELRKSKIRHQVQATVHFMSFPVLSSLQTWHSYIHLLAPTMYNAALSFLTGKTYTMTVCVNQQYSSKPCLELGIVMMASIQVLSVNLQLIVIPYPTNAWVSIKLDKNLQEKEKFCPHNQA